MCDSVRKVIHVDLDALHASVGQRDNHALRGKPVAVGHGVRHGVVPAASYEARAPCARSALVGVTLSNFALALARIDLLSGGDTANDNVTAAAL